MAGDRPKHLVLHLLEKHLRRFGLGVVIDGRGVEVSDLLVESLFRCADVADAGQPFVEIIPTLGLFQPRVVHGEALDEIFLENGICPAAELDTARRPHAVANGKDCVEIIML